MTRVVALALLFALVPTLARSEEHPDALATQAPSRLDLPALDRAYRSARARRNVGIALAIPGVGITVLGTVLFAYGVSTSATDRNILSAGLEAAWGAIVGGIGLCIAIPGIVLWILGQDNMDVLTWRRRQLTVSFAPIPLRDGASLALTLRF